MTNSTNTGIFISGWRNKMAVKQEGRYSTGQAHKFKKMVHQIIFDCRREIFNKFIEENGLSIQDSTTKR